MQYNTEGHCSVGEHKGFEPLNGRNKSGGVLCESNTIMVKPLRHPSKERWSQIRNSDNYLETLKARIYGKDKTNFSRHLRKQEHTDCTHNPSADSVPK